MNQENYIFDSKSRTLTKIEKKTKVYSCDLCLKKFNNKTKFKIHVRFHEQNYHCTHCDGKYSTYSFLRTHNLKNHNVVLPIISEEANTCVLCDGKFFNHDYYNHLHHQHDYVYPNKQVCKSCNNVFSFDAMIRHQKKCFS